MDPMQVQNQQPIQPTMQPVVQNIPQQVQVPVQQVQVPVQQIQVPVQEDGIFDKILKGLVDFIAKLAGPVPATPVVSQQQPIQGGVPVQQPQVQTIPGANFFNKIGSTLDSIGNQAEKMVQTGTSTVINGAQNYVAEQPAPVIDTQQFLSQNYQPNTQAQPVVPVQQPVATPTTPEVVQPTTPEVVQPTTPNQQ